MPPDPTEQPSLFERILIPAILILGLLVTATWTVALAYGAIELAEKTL
jgi:hypothetical protein